MNHRINPLALCLALILGGVATAAEPALTIPRLKKAPTLDGVLEPGEWDGASQVSGLIDQFDRKPSNRPVTFWIGFDDKNLYVAQRSTVQPREWEQKSPRMYWFDGEGKASDSCFVIAVAPGRPNTGEGPSHYVLRFNLQGLANYSEYISKYGGVQLTWPPREGLDVPVEHKYAYNADKTEWTSEVAIRLASMKVDAVQDGENWGLLLARDYDVTEPNASVVSSDWRFGVGRIMNLMAFSNGYGNDTEYAKASLGGPPVKQSVPIESDQPRQPVVSVPDFSFQGYTAQGSLPATTDLLEQYGLTAAVVGGSGGAQGLCYDPITGDFCARLDLKTLPESTPKVARGEIVIRKGGERKPVITHVLDFPAENRAGVDIRSVRFSLPGLAPGVYRATANLYSAEEKLVGQAQQIFIRYDHTRDLPWLGAKIGVSDQVLPPWTPIKRVEGLGARVSGKTQPDTQELHPETSAGFSCWGRTYYVAGSGLFTGIDTMAQSGIDQTARDILAGPVRVEVIQDGKAVALTASELKDVKTAAHEASYRGELAGNGWRITTQGRMEYDGYVEHWLTIAPEGEQQVDRIRLVIPLEPEEATSLHAVGGRWFRNDVSSIQLDGDGVLWDSSQAHGLGLTPHRYGVQTQVGNFRPYVWVGGANRGLAFMADNDQGWVPDERSPKPPGTLRFADGKVGKSLSCTGKKERLSVPHAAALEPEQLTLSAWVFPQEQRKEGDVRRWIVNKNAHEETQGHYALILSGKAAGAYLNIGGGKEGCVAVVCDEDLKLNQWHHLAMTYDGRDLKLYVNGILSASKAVNKKRVSGNGSLVIGARVDGHGPGLVGRVDEVRLYSRSLADTELHAMAQNPAGPVTKDLAGAWACDTDTWDGKNDGTPAIEVVRKGDHVNLVLNLVARPFAFTKPREIRFSLQATPIRPLASDFRERARHLSLRTAFTTHDSLYDEGGTKLIFPKRPPGHISGGKHGSVPYPINWDRFIAFREKYEKEGKIVTPYQSWADFQRGAENVDPRTPPGKQGPDVAGYLWPFAATGVVTWPEGPTWPEMEYRLYCYQAWIKHGGLKALYFDLSEPTATANVAAGAGYLLDLPDRPKQHGQVQPGYLMTTSREFGKRLRTLFVESGEKDPMIWVHDTDGTMISAFAFVDAFLDGENFPRLNESYPWFSEKYAPERMQAVCNPAKLGIPAIWLDMSEGAKDKELDRKMRRSYQGYARVHDFEENWASLDWAPFDATKSITFLPYWDPQVAAALKTTTPNILVSAYRQDNKLQVVVFNRSAEQRAGVEIAVDAAALGLRDVSSQLKATDLVIKGWEPPRPGLSLGEGGISVAAGAAGSQFAESLPMNLRGGSQTWTINGAFSLLGTVGNTSATQVGKYGAATLTLGNTFNIGRSQFDLYAGDVLITGAGQVTGGDTRLYGGNLVLGNNTSFASGRTVHWQNTGSNIRTVDATARELPTGVNVQVVVNPTFNSPGDLVVKGSFIKPPGPAVSQVTVNGPGKITLTGSVTGFSNLHKLGAGTLAIDGAASVTHDSRVSDGTLLVNGSWTTQSRLDVNGRLGGNGTITGPVKIQTGGGVVVDWTQYTDALDIVGTVDLSKDSTLTLVGTPAKQSTRYVILKATTINGTFNTVTGLGGGKVDYSVPNEIAVISGPTAGKDAPEGGSVKRSSSTTELPTSNTKVSIPASAAGGNPSTYYWDSNGSEAGSGVNPNGTWGDNTYWNPVADGTGTPVAWVDSGNAVFSAGRDAVSAKITVSGAQAANQVIIEKGVYTFIGEPEEETFSWKTNGKGGALAVSIGPHDYRIILIEAQDNK